jgi:hypothetical protein
MKIKHRLYTRNHAEVVIPDSINDSTLTKFLETISIVGGNITRCKTFSRWKDRIAVNGCLLECLVLENFKDCAISKEAKDFLTECDKMKVDEFDFVFVIFK